MMSASTVLALAAGGSAFVAALCAVNVLEEHRRQANVRRRAAQINGVDPPPSKLDDRVVAFIEATSRSARLGAIRPVARVSRRTERWCDEHLRQAGLEERVTSIGLAESRWRLAVAAVLAGALLGAVFSWEMMAFLACAGALLGWNAAAWAVRQRQRRRVEELERHLPEMLEVVALGLRSGLSFDRGLGLYANHFDTLLAHSCASAERQWSLGLVAREEALRALAASYASTLFSRVIENIIRSLRFGSSLAEGLEDAATEARAAYRARKQEQVAKAPVKMMVPTGTLMLPAMLILVLGPVLLELMEGF